MVAFLSTPCLAQEIEKDSLFSIEGTRWVYCYIEFGIGCFPGSFFCFPLVRWWCDDWAFYQGDVYWCTDDLNACGIRSNASYIDTPLVSIVSQIEISSFVRLYNFAILQPTGFGVYTGFGWYKGHPKGGAGFHYRIGIMIKVADNWATWTPPEEE
jgi:hypothetical protein